jgi:hypothetical protein
MNDLAQLLRELEATCFFGSLELKFESGHVVLLKKTETLKPTQLSYGDNRGTAYERNQSLQL